MHVALSGIGVENAFDVRSFGSICESSLHSRLLPLASGPSPPPPPRSQMLVASSHEYPSGHFGSAVPQRNGCSPRSGE
jgi:hypothetical protein